MNHAYATSALAASASCLCPTFASAAIAFAPPALVDVANNKPTFGDTAFGAPTSRGNDGVDGNANSGNWTHADYPTSATPYPGQGVNAPNPYWEVDLQGAYDLAHVVLTDRVGCCDPSRLDGSLITFFDAVGGVVATETVPTDGIVFGQTFTFDNAGAGYGNVARVRVDGVNGGSPIQYFQFSEFDAFSVLSVPINWAAGAAVGFYDAAGSAFGTWPGFPPSNLTDGSVATISHGADPLPHAGYYWEIDLGQEVFVDNIGLTGRGFADACCPERLENYTIELFDNGSASTFSYTHSGITQFTDNIDVIGMTGGDGPVARFLRITNANGADYGPQIGEVQVFGVAVPEPTTPAFLALALAGFLRRRRR
jgi:hypothetical protein